MKTKLILIAVLFLSLLSPALADDTDDIARAEAYLQSLNTLKADFVQTAYDGSQMTGTFYLNRPGRLRFEYNEIDDFIVADGTLIYYYDSEMKQQSNAPISSSLADFLLRGDIRLGGDISVTEIRRAPGLLQIVLTLREDPGAGSLGLTFADFGDGTLQLKSWTVTDSQNLTTQIALKDVKTGLKFDRDLFFYRDPEHQRSRYN